MQHLLLLGELFHYFVCYKDLHFEKVHAVSSNVQVSVSLSSIALSEKQRQIWGSPCYFTSFHSCIFGLLCVHHHPRWALVHAALCVKRYSLQYPAPSPPFPCQHSHPGGCPCSTWYSGMVPFHFWHGRYMKPDKDRFLSGS